MTTYSTTPGRHAVAGTTHGRTPRKAALASWLGSTLEYYDFFIYGTAASLVFAKIFFPHGNAAVATVSSLATFGLGYLARPLGGLVMGHYGDRIGRRTALLVTLIIMGTASTAIGLLPTYDSVGIWAPILLVVCRLLQGFSAGAESAGASTLTMEHSPEARRGFFTSFVMMGYASGMVLATIVFIPLAALPDEAMNTWGWRVPFLVSVVVLAIAYWVRTHLDETPVFEEAKEEDHVAAVPALLVLRTQWRDVLRVIFATIFSVVQTIFTVWALSYATTTWHIPRTTMLTVNAVAVGLSMVSIPAMALVSDRVGRKPVLLVGAVGCAASMFGYLWAISTRDMALIWCFALLNQSLFYSCWNGVWPVFFPEMFAQPVRYTGMAMGNQLGLIIAGFAPSIAAAIAGVGAQGFVPVAWFVVGILAVAAVAIATARETHRVPLDELGPLRVREELEDAEIERHLLPAGPTL